MKKVFKKPPADKTIHVEDLTSDAVFNRPYEFAMKDVDLIQLQNDIDEIILKVYESRDDRAVVLVGSIIVEKFTDDILNSFLPGYSDIDEKVMTFSLKIELIRA